MNKVPSAEEFATEYDNMRMPRGVSYQKEIGEMMIDFAKLHIEAQNKAILEKAYALYQNDEEWRGYSSAKINKNSVINAYPLDLIK